MIKWDRKYTVYYCTPQYCTTRSICIIDVSDKEYTVLLGRYAHKLKLLYKIDTKKTSWKKKTMGCQFLSLHHSIAYWAHTNNNNINNLLCLKLTMGLIGIACSGCTCAASTVSKTDCVFEALSYCSVAAVMEVRARK